MADLDRRDLLRGVGAAAMLAATGGCEILKQQINTRPVRRNILSLNPNGVEMQTFRAGVSAMKALPTSDPRNWERQAKIHYDFCPHGNWFFLPWHRAYLYSFEEIIRTLTGNADFALPYWNWAATCPRSPLPWQQWWDCSILSPPCRIPPAFSDLGSSLFHPRAVGPCHLVSWWMPILTQAALAETNFWRFASHPSSVLRGGNAVYGILEATVHNHIHSWIGGDMGSYMSPRDPIFWCHHNMIDCLWAHWNMVLGRANTNDPQWTQFQLLGMFVDGNGNPAGYQVGTMPIYPYLLYRCENDATGLPGSLRVATPGRGEEANHAHLQDQRALERFLREGADVRFDPLSTDLVASDIEVTSARPTTVRLAIPEPQLVALLRRAQEIRIFLRLREVSAPADDSVYIRVFVDNPQGDETTPLDDPSYAGTFAFFTDPEAMPMVADYMVEISGALRHRARRGGFSGEIAVTLFPAPVANDRPPSRAPIRFGQAFIVTTVLDPSPPLTSGA